MSMTPGDVSALSRLLDEASTLGPDARDAWLAALPSEQAHLRDRLREMLAEQDRQTTGGPLSTLPRLCDEATAQRGDIVGPYRLLREIGHGGMGIVWLAERADGSFERQVALKLPRLAWGAGLAERMAREREIGMLLEHVAIARLYDAGVDERGRPYLALEYIDGEPLDAWCAARALSVPARLLLFLQVVRAVVYAHGRLVVHRDLKPSNVLVSADGQAHLLDFGIAKRLIDAVPGTRDLTQDQGRALTPHYASPEQVAGEAITVASDVYSLGVLLYQLLTGALPFESRLPGALESAILQGDAPLASSRVKDKTTARALRGEVDAILAKAMQRDPERRYATANALARDIERHLAGETVAARPDSVTYRLRKAARRHWIGASASAAVLVAIFAGSTVAVVMAQRATRSAERERVVKEFVADVFRVNARDSSGAAPVKRLPPEMFLEQSAQLVHERFSGQPALEAELYGVVGDIFADMGASTLAAEYAGRQLDTLVKLRAPGKVRARATLRLAESLLDGERPGAAEPHARQALDLAEDDAPLRARGLTALAHSLIGTGRFEDAARTLDVADALMFSMQPAPRREQAWALALRAEALVRSNRLGEAFQLYERGAELAIEGEGPASVTAALIRLTGARWYRQVGDTERTTRLFDPAVATLRAAGGPLGIRAAVETARHWQLLYISPQWVSSVDARNAIEQSLVELRANSHLVPPALVATAEMWLARVLNNWGDVAGASNIIDRDSTLALTKAESPLERFLMLANIALNAMDRGRHDEAARLFEQVRQGRIAAGRGKHPFAANDYVILALNAMMAGDKTEAERWLLSAPEFEPIRTAGWNPRRFNNDILQARALVRLDMGDADGALALLPARKPEPQDSSLLYAWIAPAAIRGEALCVKGQARQGLALLEEHLKAFNPDHFEHSPKLAWMRSKTGLCAFRAGDRGKAAKYASQARAAFAAQPDVSPYYKAPLLKLESALGLSVPTG